MDATLSWKQATCHRSVTRIGTWSEIGKLLEEMWGPEGAPAFEFTLKVGGVNRIDMPVVPAEGLPVKAQEIEILGPDE